MRVVLAYLDPVTGTALVQVVLGAMAVVGLGYQYFLRGWRNLWSRLRRESPQSEIQVENADA